VGPCADSWVATLARLALTWSLTATGCARSDHPKPSPAPSATSVTSAAASVAEAAVLQAALEVAMVRVPAGTYKVGLKEPNQHPVQGLPLKKVETPGFELDVTEVTVAAYATCVDAAACTKDGMSDERCNWDKPQLSEHPINCVAFKQAAAYCTWAGKRLPTDDEWEIAFRLDLPAHHSAAWDMELGCTTADTHEDCKSIAGGPAPELHRDRPLGTCLPGTNKLKESRLGIVDLMGNVAEWTTGRYCTWNRPWCEANVVRGIGWCANWYDEVKQRTLGEETSSPAPGLPTWVVGMRCAR
jgi:formylglycine-generating enzyme required for sulfatase activity